MSAADRDPEAVGMCTPGGHTPPTRIGLLATAVGLNFSVAGMLTMAASAMEWLEGSAFWNGWLALAGFTTLLTARRLCHAMAPLFWVSIAPRVASHVTKEASAQTDRVPWQANLARRTCQKPADVCAAPYEDDLGVWSEGSKRPPTSTNSMRQGWPERLAQAWLVPRCTTTLPGPSTRSLSSSTSVSSPAMTTP